MSGGMREGRVGPAFLLGEWERLGRFLWTSASILGCSREEFFFFNSKQYRASNSLL